MDNNSFHTFSEYMKNEENLLTASMEDYLEMIYRLSIDKGFTRINELSEALNVHPPSATRMVQRLGELNLLLYEKYGVIILKDEGKKLGEFLLKRHKTIEAFLRVLGINEEKILKETEKVEHTLSDETTRCFEKYICFIKDNPDVISRFDDYKNSKS
ncbi:transcriptional regulator MntR [Clostridium folliculivorans]|uniref:Manganese transport regulator n=1 Tax=Clostridium folliculivorans TaxID=2886038 RepID=A0A9W6DCI4_9CLOT|nr:transcriptional regulator MntR [Clostridium folliculivorans]GKU26778.1 Fur family transcriptional regulator [Clostridium folliculivorans]GKU31372.1 Fur family transcriptional regulator [Clostridium folliculivorans]